MKTFRHRVSDTPEPVAIMAAMKRRLVGGLSMVGLGAVALSCTSAPPSPPLGAPSARSRGYDSAQVPGWSDDDLEFFLHGSMSTEVVPERVLAAFRATYPELFPGEDLSAFGFVQPPGELPIGISRREVPHLANLPSFGLNCASCHVAELRPDSATAPPVRVIGTTGHFDAEAFLGAVTVAQFMTADAGNMSRFLREWYRAGGRTDPMADALLDMALDRSRDVIRVAVASDPMGGKGVAPGQFQPIAPSDLDLSPERVKAGVDLGGMALAFLRLFHNMRTALHIPDQLPSTLPPASGPGRNDAFGLLSAELFNAPTDYAPVKYGILWNASSRPWVHWDGNTRSALGRNLLASVGLGAPLVDGKAQLELPLVQRHTDITQEIRPPAWPWEVDRAAAERGAVHYAARCASCHDGQETDARLCAIADVGTDPTRASVFDGPHAENFNRFFREVRIDGFTPPAEPPIRSTGKYFSASLDGVWARAPYLHNGSARTMEELLTKPAQRPRSHRRGTHVYDTARLGYQDGGPYVFDTATPGNGNGGHEYGTDLDAASKRDLIEYLKTK